MKSISIMVAIAVSILAKPAQAGPPVPDPSEQYEITHSYETSQQDSEGSSGNTSGRSGLLERVIGEQDGGLELEYDLPQNASEEDRTREWKFPARVLRQSDGTLVLLNGAELETRLERWLEAAEWTREICGRWIFTWTAFRIDCDPQSVIDIIAEIDLRSPDLREGAAYRHTGSRDPGTLRRIAEGQDGARFTAILDIDPEAVRLTRAESDVAVGEIMQRPVSLDAALRARARESISGTIEVTFETDLAGNAIRRTTVTRLETSGPEGRSASEIRTETTERRRVLYQ